MPILETDAIKRKFKRDQLRISSARCSDGRLRTDRLRHIGDSPTCRRSECLHNTEFFHSRFKRRRLDIKLFSGPMGSANTPVASLECPNNVVSFGFFKRAVGWFDDLRLKRL